MDTERQIDSAVPASHAAAGHGWLRVFTSAVGRPRRIPASGLVIGRAELEVDDSRMSRQHARIERDGGGWRLRDLGSRNGGYVDGAPLEAGGIAPLADGSVIRLGDTVAVFALRETSSAGSEPDDGEFFPGASAIAHDVRVRVRRLASASGHVLVLGETGTGKERVARRLAGDAGVFVPQNCAEMQRDLARADLFGHARGAFTGATTAREGLIEAARDGVLFLDEIGELPLDVQGELLRFLEDGSYRPIGASELRISPARVVAATNVDLDEAVRAGSFRRDLLARLRASNRPLELPPLRERREDIPAWAVRFLHDAVAYPPPIAWSAGVLECLLLYPWRENLRELRGVIRGLVEATVRWPLDPSRLPAALQAHRRALRAAADEPSPVVAERGTTEAPTEAPGAEHVTAALTQTKGSMRAAAELLGIERRRLYRLCEKHGIDPEPFRRGE